MSDIPVPPSTDLVGEVADLLHAVGHRVRRGIRAELEPLGLTPARARALAAVVRADDAGSTVRMGDLAAQLRVAPRTATEVVDALAAAGLVERASDPCDQRAVTLRPTGAGRETAERAAGARHRTVAAMAADLAPADVEALRALLGRLDEG